MSRVEFRLAEELDDPQLRELLRRTAMPGNVTLAFLREPDYFIAERAGSVLSQTLVCCESDTGEIVAVGGRSLRRVYLNGEPVQIGYLSTLRTLPRVRGGSVLARGYRFLHDLHSDGRAPFCLTSILDENANAIATLTSGRAGLPRYEPIGRLITYLLPLRRRRPVPRTRLQIERVTSAGLSDAAACLDTWSRRHSFAPVYTAADLEGETGLLPGFEHEDLFVAKEGAQVRGTLGLWDHLAFKQTLIAGYSAGVALGRPWHNAIAWLRGRPGLPRVGEQIRSIYGAFLSAADDDADLFKELLQTACHHASGKGYDYLALGLTEDHPLTSAVASQACRTIVSRLYAVYWPGKAAPDFDRAGPLHVEIATL